VTKPDPLTITVSHDEAQRVWYVLSSDIPGLNAEAQTLDGLVEVIADLAPDLIAANLPSLTGLHPSQIPVCVQHMVSNRRARAA
jgi:hypothetical protein